jgi:hypothetical protein
MKTTENRLNPAVIHQRRIAMWIAVRHRLAVAEKVGRLRCLLL